MKNISTFILFLFAFSLNAQVLTPSVLASGGNYQENSGYSLSSTVGEIAVTTLSNTTYMLTQGFQQPLDWVFTSIKKDYHLDLDMILYPNPAKDQINILISGTEMDPDISVLIYNAFGQLFTVPQNRMYERGALKIVLDINNLAAGNYFIRIPDEKLQSQNKDLRFIKLN
jgi:hypothetical protein